MNSKTPQQVPAIRWRLSRVQKHILSSASSLLISFLPPPKAHLDKCYWNNKIHNSNTSTGGMEGGPPPHAWVSRPARTEKQQRRVHHPLRDKTLDYCRQTSQDRGSPTVLPQVLHGLIHILKPDHLLKTALFSTKLLLLCVCFVDFLNSKKVLKPCFPVYHYPQEQQHRDSSPGCTFSCALITQRRPQDCVAPGHPSHSPPTPQCGWQCPFSHHCRAPGPRDQRWLPGQNCCWQGRLMPDEFPSP